MLQRDRRVIPRRNNPVQLPLVGLCGNCRLEDAPVGGDGGGEAPYSMQPHGTQKDKSVLCKGPGRNVTNVRPRKV